MESIPGEDTVKIIAMRTKDLEYYIKLVEKAEARFKRLILILKEILLWLNAIK